MNLFDLITNSLAPTATTAKGSIVTIAKDGSKVWDKISSSGRVLATYNAGKILGTVQQVNKAFVLENGIITKKTFLIVRVKLSEPIKFSSGTTYTDVWALAESLDIFATAASTTPTNTDLALYSTGSGVRVRTSASKVGEINQAGNNIITSYQKGDIIGYTDKKVTNGFYKVKFLTPQTKKEDGKKYDFGYVSVAYSSISMPVVANSSSSTKSSGKTTVQDSATQVVDDSKVSSVATADTSTAGTYRNRYGLVLIGAGIFGLFGVIVWAVKSLSKIKKNGSK